MGAHITDNFTQDVENADRPVLVDFYADWCGPCKAIAPILDQLADERDDVDIVKLNIDNHPDVAQKYGVMSIPTLIMFDGGNAGARAVGAKSKDGLNRLIDAAL